MIQQKEKYFNWLVKDLKNFAKDKKNLKVFLYGSSIRRDQFGDVDVGLEGKVTDKDVRQLEESFAESNFPFFVEVVNFNKVKKPFRDNVFNNEILWIKR